MLLGFMLTAGLVTFILEWQAHQWMRERTYTTPIPRYAVGVTLALAPWTAASASVFIEPWATTNAAVVIVAGAWYVFGMAAGATWLAYERDRPQATEADIEKLAGYLAGEHGDAETSGN